MAWHGRGMFGMACWGMACHVMVEVWHCMVGIWYGMV